MIRWFRKKVAEVTGPPEYGSDAWVASERRRIMKQGELAQVLIHRSWEEWFHQRMRSLNPSANWPINEDK